MECILGEKESTGFLELGFVMVTYVYAIVHGSYGDFLWRCFCLFL